MKNLPFTSRHIVFISVGVVFGFILSFGLNSGILQTFLAELHIPSWTLTLCVILFCIWLFAAMQKAAVIASYPVTADYKQVDLSKIADIPMDLEKLEEWDSTLQALGFKMVTEFAIKLNSPVILYGRLLVNEEQQCRAEIIQGFFQKPLRPSLALTCAIGSYMDQDKTNESIHWELLTVNNNEIAKSPIEWMLRNSYDLWSYHSDLSLSQLFSFHLAKRKEIEKAYQLTPVTGLTWKKYCNDFTAKMQRRRVRLLRKPGVILLLESLFCKNKTEWWGDFRKFMSTEEATVADVA